MSTTDPLILLWRIARMWLADAADAFGGPAEIVALLARKTQAAAKRRLKALESLVLKLLLIEAARMKPPPDRRLPAGIPSANVVSPAGSRRSDVVQDPANPQTWRVRFALRIPRTSSPPPRYETTGPRIRDLGPPRLVTQVFETMARRAQLAHLAAARAGARSPERTRAKALALAHRFEALRRVLADPRPHARRLARRLRAMAGAAAYAAATLIAAQVTPLAGTNPVVHQHAQIHAARAAPAFSPDSS